MGPEGEEGLTVRLAAGRAGRVGPVADGEGILSLGLRLGVAGEEPWQEGVGGRSEGVNRELPTQQASQVVGVVADQRAADWASNVGGDLPGQPIHSFGDEDRARRVEVLRVAPGGVLEHGKAP